ncbi:MAG: glutamate-5-semialdehyde dehydrogenase [Actinomycetota bacterium]|nr:glutamate-5-semialdehyde dehydrogenase [Actinomycetota bacterium]
MVAHGPVSLDDLGAAARESSRVLARSSSSQRDDALRVAADLLESQVEQILAVNAGDVATAEADGATPTVLDRLRLDGNRVAAMAAGLRTVAGLADPLGRVVAGWVRPNGLRVSQVRVPLGVVGIIYENRPNVTSDAFGLCLKAGNAVLLRGSSSALATNGVIVGLLKEGVTKAGLPAGSVGFLAEASHESAVAFMRATGTIDCLVPRGGPALIAAVREHATVPYVIDGDGNCHVFVDASADLAMAESIVVNAKTQRPGVCNAMETLLVHRSIAPTFLPRVATALEGVELRGDETTCALVPGAVAATEADWATEYLAPVLAVRVVDDLDGALDHIARYGSGHSEAIVTSDVAAADRFTAEVDAAAVLVNASTRFVDGEELGLGAEIGISTQKLHARGPMGLEALTSVRWVVRGDGQVRR